MEVHDVVLGATTRAVRTTVFAAGKGISVAVGAATFGVKAVATGIVGEKSKDMFLALNGENVVPLFVFVPGETRNNITLVETGVSRETHIQTTGYLVAEKDIETLRQIVTETVCSGDVLVIAGSLPEDVPATVTAEFIELGKNRGAFVILDSSGDSLRNGLEAKPHMVKPNLKELGSLVREDVEEAESSVISAAREVLQAGPELVVVSRGRMGVIVAQRGSEFVWKAYLADRSRSEIFTAGVGCGDSLVSAFAVSKLKGESLENAVRLGVASGAANLSTRAPGRFSLSDVRALEMDVHMEQIR